MPQKFSDAPMHASRFCNGLIAPWPVLALVHDGIKSSKRGAPLVPIHGLIGLHAVLASCYPILIRAIRSPSGVDDAAVLSNAESLKKSTER